MYKIPTDFHGRDEARDAIVLLSILVQEIEESISLCLNLVDENTITRVKTAIAVKQAKMSKLNNAIGFITALHQFSTAELAQIESEVYGYDPSLG